MPLKDRHDIDIESKSQRAQFEGDAADGCSKYQ